MQGLWRTVLSTNIVAASPSSIGRALLTVSDFGEVFRIPLDDLSESAFHLESISRFRLPDGLREPVGGLVLPDGRMAAWCGGREPALWTINSTGHLEQRWPLPAAPETDPVPLAGGIATALPGRLHMTASGRRVDDYRNSDELNQQVTWKALVPVSDTQLLALNSDDQLVRVEYRTSPRPHLAEVSITQMDGSIDVAPVASGEFLVVVTVDGRLILMRAATLELLAEVQLEAAAGQPAAISGNRLFVDVGGREVRVFDFSAELTATGSFPLNRDQLVSPPLALADGGFLAALSGGTVLRLDPDGNSSGPPVRLSQQLQRGPLIAGETILVVAFDGSLYSLNDLLTR